MSSKSCFLKLYIPSNDQLEDSKESSRNISDSDNLDFQSKMTVSVMPAVTSSVTSVTNTLSTDKVEDDTDLDEDDIELDVDDFEIIDSDELN